MASALRPTFLLLAALALAAAVCGVLGSRAARAEDEAPSPRGARLEAIDARVEKGESREAIRELEAWLEETDEATPEAELRERLGRLHVALGEPYAALQHLEALVELRGDPADRLAYAEALLAVARTHMSESGAASVQVLPYLLDSIEAATLAGEGEEVRPSRLMIEGEARYWMGELEAAVAAWEKIEEGALPEAQARRTRELLGHALYGLGRYEEAATTFRAVGNPRAEASAWAAARKGRETAEVYGHLLAESPGDAALLDEAWRAARYVGAEDELRSVLEELDAPPEALGPLLLYRALLAEATGDEEAALDRFAQAAEALPDEPRPLVELGRLRLSRAGGADEAGRDAAAQAFLEALGRSPDDERTLGFLWAVAGQDYAAAWRSPRALERSLRIQRALIEACPDDALALANAGNTLRVAGRLEEALRTYDQAARVEPSDAAIRSDRGLVLSALGRTEEALRAFLHAAELDASYDAARQNAGRALWLAGKDAEAEAELAAGLASARAVERGAMRYRFLLDRTWRTRQREALR